MEWTKDTPTTPGWYWWTDEDEDKRQFNLQRGYLGMMLWYRDHFGWVPIPSYGEWAGPIPEPTERQEG